MKTQLTISQAIAEGYEKCGYNGRDWQHLMNISEMMPEDFDSTIVLAEKIPNHYLTDWTDFRDTALDGYFGAEHQEDDFNGVQGDLNQFKTEFTALSEKVNEYFKTRPWWKLTNIKLIP